MLQGVGSSGQIGAVIATVVICCLIFSLIESQLILPAHLGNKQTKTAKARFIFTGAVDGHRAFAILMEYVQFCWPRDRADDGCLCIRPVGSNG